MTDDSVFVEPDGSEVVSGSDSEQPVDSSSLPDSAFSELREAIDAYANDDASRYDALSSQVSEGFKAVRADLAKLRETDKKGADETPLVELSDEQWQFVHDSAQVQSTCALMSLLMVCMLCGVVLWALFSRGWGAS